MSIRLFLAAALALFCLIGSAAPALARQDATVSAEARALAEQLLPEQARKAEPREQELLFRLQLATGRNAEAEATIRRLQAGYHDTDPVRARTLTPWLIYAKAARSGDAAAGFDEAFQAVYANIADREAVELLAWYSYDLERGRRTLADAKAACGDKALAQCETGVQVLRAELSLAVWSVMTPRAKDRTRSDLARRFIISEDILVPSSDGAQIAVMLARPRSAEPQTALLNFTIYANDEWSYVDAVKMAGRGYVGVVAYTRGKGRSPGQPVPYVHDGEDAAAVIDWLAAQPWSDGRVGMFSGSYNASTQWAAARRLPKALKAIATNASNAPGIDTPMEGNVFHNFMYPWPFYTTNVKALDDETYDDLERWGALNRAWYVSGRPYRDLPAIDGTPNPVFMSWLDHPSYDAFWRQMLPFGREFARIRIPVLVQTGYFDGGMVGALYYLRQHYKHYPQADHRLLIGPYHHLAMQQGVRGEVEGYELDIAARIDLQEVRMQWFDHVFRGAPLPELLQDRINFQVMGANRWRHVPSLDAMGDKTLRLHLDERTSPTGFTLAEARPGRAGYSQLIVDMRDRSDADYEPPAAVGGREIDRRNALVFATAPFREAIEVNGAFTGRIRASVNKRDFDLSVALYELTAEGTYFPLTSYVGRASYMEERTRRRLLRPGRVETLRFESPGVTSRRMAAGSRIVAVVGVPKRPDVQINYGSGKDVSDESVADAGAPMHIRFLNDSWLEIRTMAADAP